jgi:DNA-directed RNA polymerase subunit RPC12/RpoP
MENNKSIYYFSVDRVNINSKDMNCVSYFCANCETIFHSDLYEGVEINVKHIAECPKCKIKFTGYLMN